MRIWKIPGWLILWGCILLAACSKKEKLEIPRETIQQIAMQVHLAEAAIQQAPLKKRDSLSAVYFSAIAAQHGLTEEKLVETMDLLLRDPEKIRDIYPEVVDQLPQQSVRLRKNKY